MLMGRRKKGEGRRGACRRPLEQKLRFQGLSLCITTLYLSKESTVVLKKYETKALTSQVNGA